MLYSTGGICRFGVLLATFLIASCAVEPPQQPAPKPKAPPASTVPAPPSPPPSVSPPVPKIYTGPYPDRVEAAARDMFAGSALSVVRNGNTIKLILPVNVAFAVNSSQLQPRFAPTLDSIAKLCIEYNKTAITVKGFTDSTGSFEHNQDLSEQRAQNIGAYLSRTVAAARIHTAGYGPRNPIADNKTETGRMQNRRVEIDMVVMP